MASKWVKPNGLTIITTDKILNFLEKTPIEKIWGIGPKTAEFLQRRNIKTALNFVDKDLAWVRFNLSKPYEVIWQELQGVMIMKIDPEIKTVYSSVQKTRTFYPPTNDKVFLLSQLSKNIEEACHKARYYKLVPKKISFFLKTQNFKYLTYLITLSIPTNAPEVLISIVNLKFRQIYNTGILYRTTGVILQELVSVSIVQGDLFGNSNQSHKFEVIHQQIDLLEGKFGKKVVYLGSTHQALKQKGSKNEVKGISGEKKHLFI